MNVLIFITLKKKHSLIVFINQLISPIGCNITFCGFISSVDIFYCVDHKVFYLSDPC